MAFRACFALMVVMYMAVLLIQVEVSYANNATTVAETNNVTEAESNTTKPATTAEVVTVPATTAAPTEAPTTKPTGSGAEGMFSILPFAVYGLCSALVAMM